MVEREGSSLRRRELEGVSYCWRTTERHGGNGLVGRWVLLSTWSQCEGCVEVDYRTEAHWVDIAMIILESIDL